MKLHFVRIARIEPFAEVRGLPLARHLTIIRGPNGSGKTTVLEGLALLGHCSLMSVESWSPVGSDKARVEIEVSLGDSDRLSAHPEFIAWLCRPDRPASSPTLTMKECRAVEAELRSEFDALSMKPHPEAWASFTLRMRSQGSGILSDLKEILTDEAQLAEWLLSCSRGEAAATYCRCLIEFSRPRETQTKQAARRRFLTEVLAGYRPDTDGGVAEDLLTRLANHEPSSSFSRPFRASSWLEPDHPSARIPLPALVSYINTDMYEWGIGLDIRESPKQLSKELALLMRDRLHLYVDGVTHGQQIRVPHEDAIREFWAQAFVDVTTGSCHECLTGFLCRADGLEVGSGRTAPQIIPMITSARQFLSSGENQILSLALMIEGLDASRSVFLLDEPDLHMALPTARNMYGLLLESAFGARDNQFVVVTHQPYVFRKHLARVVAPPGQPEQFVEDQEPGTRVIGLAYLDKTRTRAVLGDAAIHLMADAYNQEFGLIATQMEIDEQQMTFPKAIRSFIQDQDT